MKRSRLAHLRSGGVGAATAGKFGSTESSLHLTHPGRHAAVLAADPAIIPLGSDQTEVRTTYRALFEHIGGGGRAHWAQQGFNHAGQDYASGTVVAPTGLASSGFDNRVVSGTVNALPSLALDAVRTRGAVFRTTVSDPSYSDAAWELADVRETLDTYLWGSLRYDVLDEAQLVAADLSQ